MKKFENLEKSMCRELEIIENKLQNGTEMSETELKRADILLHAMKSLATYNAMKESEEYEYEESMSGRRGRSGMNGRYMSRDYGPRSYDDGYSGHYPPNWNYLGPRW